MRMMLATAALGTLAMTGCQKPAEQGSSVTTAETPAAVTPGLSPTPAPTVAASTGQALGLATDSKGELRMDVTEAVRTGGVLTIKTRATLVGGKPGSRPLPGSSDAEVYLTAGDKKYLMLKDDHDKPIMSSANYPGFDNVGATSAWWGKFPAPPAEVKAVDFYFYGFEPVENVAITDR